MFEADILSHRSVRPWWVNVADDGQVPVVVCIVESLWEGFLGVDIQCWMRVVQFRQHLHKTGDVP